MTHVFKDHGFEFDTGVHYIGKIQEGDDKVFDLVAEAPFKWCKLGSEDPGRYIYDEAVIGILIF